MPTIAWPASWNAVRRRSSSDRTIDRGAPRMIFSSASVKSSCSTCSWRRRAAISAASLQRFARSAPTMPGVIDASRARSTSSPSGSERVCTSRIARRPSRSGAGTVTRRSKRPGRRSAESSVSGRLVAASTMTVACESKPSISVRIWLSVCSRSSLPAPKPAPPERCRPTASSSSMNRIAGAASLAFLNVSRTRAAPTPTTASTNSEAEDEKNGTPASPATARASSVLPVPGWPVEQHAARDPPAERLVALRVLEEVDDLGELLLGLLDPGDVVEGDLRAGGLEAAGARAAEAADRARPAAAAHDVEEQQHEQDHRAEAEQDRREQAAAQRDRRGVDLDAVRRSAAARASARR